VSRNSTEPPENQATTKVAGHTAGPWGLSDERQTANGNPRLAIVAAVGKFTFASLARLNYWRDQSRDGRHRITLEEATANGRLMAAAPDLLEGCRKAMTCASIDSNVRALIRDAIAKAEGRSK
jgi:hypothetical protein